MMMAGYGRSATCCAGLCVVRRPGCGDRGAGLRPGAAGQIPNQIDRATNPAEATPSSHVATRLPMRALCIPDVARHPS